MQRYVSPIRYFAAAVAAFLSLSGCQQSAGLPARGTPVHPSGDDRVTLERNKTQVRRIIEGAFNRRDLSILPQLVSREFHSHNPNLPPGREGLEQFVRRFIDGFADFAGHVRELVAEGDKVVVWVDWQGTHTGTFAGLAATGRHVEFSSVEIFRVENGKLAEHWDVVDRFALQKGLGVIP